MADLEVRPASVEDLCIAAQSEVRMLRSMVESRDSVLRVILEVMAKHPKQLFQLRDDQIATLTVIVTSGERILAKPSTMDEPLPATRATLQLVPDLTKPPPAPVAALATQIVELWLGSDDETVAIAAAKIQGSTAHYRRQMYEALGQALVMASIEDELKD